MQVVCNVVIVIDFKSPEGKFGTKRWALDLKTQPIDLKLRCFRII